MPSPQADDRPTVQVCTLDLYFDGGGRLCVASWYRCDRCRRATGSDDSDEGSSADGLSTDLGTVPTSTSPAAVPETTAQSLHPTVEVHLVAQTTDPAVVDPVFAALCDKVEHFLVGKVAGGINDELWDGIFIWWRPQAAAEWKAIHDDLGRVSDEELDARFVDITKTLLEPTPLNHAIAAKLLGKFAFHIVSAHIAGPFHLLMDLATQMGILQATASGQLLDCATLPDAMKPLSKKIIEKVAEFGIEHAIPQRPVERRSAETEPEPSSPRTRIGRLGRTTADPESHPGQSRSEDDGFLLIVHSDRHSEDLQRQNEVSHHNGGDSLGQNQADGASMELP